MREQRYTDTTQILKKLECRDHVPNKHKSIRQYLLDSDSNMKMFSIGSVVGESVFKEDFGDRFSGLDGAVALDLDERFKGCKPGTTESMAVMDAKNWELLDG